MDAKEKGCDLRFTQPQLTYWHLNKAESRLETRPAWHLELLLRPATPRRRTASAPSTLLGPDVISSCVFVGIFVAAFKTRCLNLSIDRFCGLVVRLPGYRSRGPGIDCRRYQIFWIVGLEWDSLTLGRNSSGSGLENREYGRGEPLRSPRVTLYPQKLALTSPASGGHSAGIVSSRTKATEFSLLTFPLQKKF
jgi:hypothetical protein